MSAHENASEQELSAHGPGREPAVDTRRSGVGVDPARDLLYVSGPGLDAPSLAEVFIQAGAVRPWSPTSLAVGRLRHLAGPGAGTDLLAAMSYGPDHWLSGRSRDFIAVFTR